MKLKPSTGRPYFWQWDLCQKLIVKDNCTCKEVHFCTIASETALVCPIKEEDGVRFVNVPNILLQTDGVITAYLFSRTTDGGETRTAYHFQVLPRTKPEEYIYTETEVLTYRTLEERINQIEKNGVSDEKIGQAVADYLDENQIKTGATEEEKAQIQQNKEDIEKLTQDKLDADKLPEAVNEALAQAKESGEFKGEKGEKGDPGEPGEPGYTPQKNIDYFDGKDGKDGVNGKDGYTPQKNIDYFDGKDGKDGQDGKPGADGKTPVKGEDYFTPEEVQAIAEQAAEMVDIPSGGTMQPLTFTGAVNATYDGSVPVSVEIPQGGGGGTGGSSEEKPWRLLNTITLTEPVVAIDILTDSDGNPFEISEFLVYCPLGVIASGTSQFFVEAIVPGAKWDDYYQKYPWERIATSLNNFLEAKSKSILIRSDWVGGRYTVFTANTYELNTTATNVGAVRFNKSTPEILGGIRLCTQYDSIKFNEGTFYLYGR